jgi:type I restriction enzyme S subunit
MRDGWIETTIGEITEIVPGKYIPKSDYVENGQFVIYGSNSVMGRYSHSLIHGPHTVMAAIGAYAGAVRYSPEPSWVNNNAFGLITNSEIEPKYLFMWLATNLDLSTVVAGTGQPYVQRPMLKSTSVNIPPLTEQKRIVDLVSSVDAYIDALQQQSDTSRAARNAVLYKLLSAGGDDWSETNLGELCEIYQPETISKAQMDDNAPYIVYGANGPVGRYSRFNHEEPEVVVTCRGATCGVVNMTPPNCWITGNAMVIKPKDNRSTKAFLYWALQISVDVQATISGSAQPQITRAGLAPSKIQVPPIVEQKRIVEIVSSMDGVIQSTEHAVTYAKNLRSGLLSDLLSGEHEIPASYDSLLGAA